MWCNSSINYCYLKLGLASVSIPFCEQLSQLSGSFGLLFIRMLFLIINGGINCSNHLASLALDAISGHIF